MEALLFSLQAYGVEFVDSNTLFLIDAKIPDLPLFIRIEEVAVVAYDPYTCPKNEKEFHMFMPLFCQLKSAFIGSHLILGDCSMDNHEFLKEKLLSFFDCCKRYKFYIKLNPKEIPAFITPLLQLPSIGSSVDVKFTDNHWSWERSAPEKATSLPVEAISNWLHKQTSINGIGENRSLSIHLSNIKNASEMIEHLKKVAISFPF